jgi:sec-independent protein translocase protein TatB
MGSVGTGEILVILLVVLIVFGPERLPELARKAGQLLGKVRQMTQSLTDSLDTDYQDVVAPIKDLKSEYDSTMTELKGVATTVSGLSTSLSDPRGDATPDGSDEAVPDETGSNADEPVYDDIESVPDDDPPPDEGTS